VYCRLQPAQLSCSSFSHGRFGYVFYGYLLCWKAEIPPVLWEDQDSGDSHHRNYLGAVCSISGCYQHLSRFHKSTSQHMHVIRGLHNEFNQPLTPHLHLTLRGIKRKQASTHSSRTRLPFAINILHKIWSYLLTKQPFYSKHHALCNVLSSPLWLSPGQ